MGRLVASIAFGALWTLIGVHAAVIVFAVALTAIGAVSAIALTRSTRTRAA